MKFDRNLSLKARIAKRRRQKRARLLTAVSLAALFLLIISYNGITVESMVNSLNSLLQKNSDIPAGRVMEKDKSPAEGEEYISDKDMDGNKTGISGKNSKTAGDKTVSRNSHTGSRPTRESSISTDKGNIGSNEAAADIAPLKKELADYVKKFNGEYGIYYIDLVDGNEFGINENLEFIAASTVKIPINLYLYKKIENHQIKSDGIMTYLREDYEEGTGSIQYEKVGSKYSVRELSRLSIEVSDNVATNILLRLLERQNAKDYMRKLGGTVVSDSENISCPRDMALYMKKVYEFYKSNNTLGKELMGYFKNTAFNERIPKLLPKEVIVAHKTGNQVKAFNDVGIVFADKPYVISIMSRDVDDETEAYNVIANISKKVYNFVEEQE